MVDELPLFPEQASTVSREVDALFFFILATTVFFSSLIAVLILYFAVRYRRRPGDPLPPAIHGSTPLEVFWSVVPLVIGLGIFFWGASLYFKMSRPPDDALEVYVVGRQWMWKVQHAEGQSEINRLHVPVGQPVRLILTSEDVIHNFAVPAFRIKQDVIPGRYTHVWFQATKPGTYHLFCGEYCGTEHSRMIGQVVVLEPAEYRDWLTNSADRSLALQGRALFQKLQCVTCHSADAEAQGPVLEEIYRRKIQLADGRTIVTDENYLRESILKPNEKVVAGFRPIMPPYLLKTSPEDRNGHLTEEDFNAVIAFLKALRAGETPPRVEQAEPPVVKEP